jgi:hypothetical protein
LVQPNAECRLKALAEGTLEAQAIVVRSRIQTLKTSTP